MDSKIVKKLLSIFSTKENEDMEENSVIVDEQLIHEAIVGASAKALTLSATTESKVKEVAVSFLYSGGQEMKFDMAVQNDGVITYQTSVIQNDKDSNNIKIDYIDTFGDNLGDPIAQTIN